MMKKLLCAILTVAMFATLLTGCGLFSSDAQDAGEESTDGYEPVKISESFTFEDPADLEFDKRYVIACDASSQMVAAAADYGMTAAYLIVYAKDDAPVASYDFYVVDSEEHAQDLIDLYAAQGSTLNAREEDATVLYSSMDGDTMEGTLVAFQSYGMISEATVSAYVAFYSESIGGKVQ